MMNHLLPISLMALLLVSCDKARELADKAKTAAREQLANSDGDSASSEPDPALAALVDETAEGVIFRKDLPFPKSLTVREKESMELQKVRVFLQSELGTQSAILQNTLLRTSLYQSVGKDLRITLETLQTSEPPTSKDPEAKPVVTVDLLQGGIIDFKEGDRKWSAVGTTDFKKAVWQRELLPHLPTLLMSSAVRPKPLWFAKKRLKAGDAISIDDSLMPMFFTGTTTGNLQLVFEGRDAVSGHPCGVFTIQGNYSSKDFVSSDGTLSDREVSIESGKIWLSLLYPMILREELQTIQTYKSGKSGGPRQQAQGAIRISTTREWKAGDGTTPAP